MKVELFLDSGAFSARKDGVHIDLQDYIEFIHKNKELITVYANLDDLSSPTKTWENQMEMERQGLKPLPVFHGGEDLSYLKKILDQHEYFGIGGVALKSVKAKNECYTQVFNYAGMNPTHRIHAFGLGVPELINRFPFHSVDTTTWVLASRNGTIYRWEDNKTHSFGHNITGPDYSETDYANVQYFTDLEKVTGVTIYLVSWNGWDALGQALALTRAGYEHRLLSYYFLKDVHDPHYLETYCHLGFAQDHLSTRLHRALHKHDLENWREDNG